MADQHDEIDRLRARVAELEASIGAIHYFVPPTKMPNAATAWAIRRECVKCIPALKSLEPKP